MRAKIGLLAIAMTLLFASGAFAHHRHHRPRQIAGSDVLSPATASEIALADAVFAAPASAAAASSDRWSLTSAPGSDPSAANRVLIRQSGRVVDTTRITFDGSPLMLPMGQATPPATPDVERQRLLDVNYTRAWRGAVRIPAGSYALAVTPHAGLGFGDDGRSAEAGAELSMRQKRAPLNLFSARQGEWYVFASASGRAVGMNMIDPDGGPNMLPAAWYAEAATARINTAQAGLGWRMGHVNAMLGYVQWQVKTDIDNIPASAAPHYRASLVGVSVNLGL